jgi:hypothetical protein
MTYQLFVDVPELSARETEVAFTIPSTVKIETDAKGSVIAEGQYAANGEVRTHDGTLYRHVGRPGAWLQEAFSREKQSVNPEFGTLIAADPAKFTFNILGAPLQRQFEWQLERRSGIDSLLVSSWPMGSNPLNRSVARNSLFQDVADKIDDIDMDVHAESLEMLHTQASKLLLIDGECWIASKPPVWRVDVFDDGFTQFVTLALAHAYEGLDRKLPRREFSLDDLEAAEAYFHKCMPRAKSEKRTHRFLKSIPTIDPNGTRDFSWDAEATELARVGYAVATELGRFSQLSDPANIAVVNEALAAARSTNYILGTMGEISHLTPALCELWRNTGFHASFIDVDPAPTRLGRLVVDGIHELVDNSPIRLDVGSPVGLRF